MAILNITRIIGKNLKKYRKINNMTQVQVAEQVKLEHETISRIELGKYNVSLKSLERFAELFKVPILELVREEALAVENQAQYVAEMLEYLNEDDRKIIMDIILNAVRLCKNTKSIAP